MLNPQQAAERYQPRPQDAPRAVYEGRLKICAGCSLRDNYQCRFTGQMVSVMARPADGMCPNQSWPAKPAVPLNPESRFLNPCPDPADRLAEKKSRVAPRLVIPLKLPAPARFEGSAVRKPWDYEVTAAIPVHNSSQRLPLVIELLRLQTVRPFIVLVDCGSDPEEFQAIEALRAPDVEVHALRLHGAENSSEPIAIAMDLSLARCATRFLYCTHDDVFLRSRFVLQSLRNMASRRQAAGHRITRRPHNDWRGMFSHSNTMLDADFFVEHGLTWHMRRANRLFGIRRARSIPGTNWPDTETGINYLAQAAGVRPVLLGHEKNHQRTIDRWIDHCRSAGGRAIYFPEGAAETRRWLAEAEEAGWERVRAWRDAQLPEAPPLPVPPPAARRPLPEFTPGAY